MKSPLSQTAAVAAALLFEASMAHAAGFGQAVTHRAIFGLPLDMSVSVRTAPGEAFNPSCVRADVMFGDKRLPESQVRVDIGRVHADERKVRIRTTESVSEPVVSVNVSISCDETIARKIVTFADPPPSTLVSAEAKSAAGGKRSSNSAAAPAASRPTEPAAPTAKGSAKRVVDIGSLLGTGEAAASAPVSSAASKAGSNLSGVGAMTARVSPPEISASTPPRSRARLRLDAQEIDARTSPALKLAEGVAPSSGGHDNLDQRNAASSLWRVMNASPEELASQQARLSQLETDLSRLKKDATQTDSLVTDLRTRLADSEHRQFSTSLLYALAGVVVILFGGMVVLMRRRSSSAREPQDSWWAPSEQSVATEFFGESPQSALHEPGGAPSTSPAVVPQGIWATPSKSSILPGGGVPVPSDIQVSSPLGNDWRQFSAPPAEAPPSPAMGLDQLWALESKVMEAVAASGSMTDATVVDLLQQYVQSSQASSPMPFLMLFGIYQQQGVRQAFDELVARFSQHFGVAAPDWADDLQDVYGLSDYPEWIGPLIKAWPEPQQALDLLLDGLLHRHAGALLDAPAYSDMLTLALIARDHVAEQRPEVSTDSAAVAGADSIDLELPLGEDPNPAVFDTNLVQPMLATAPLHVQVDLPKTLPLSIDLELDAPNQAAAPVAGVAQEGDSRAATRSSAPVSRVP